MTKSSEGMAVAFARAFSIIISVLSQRGSADRSWKKMPVGSIGIYDFYVWNRNREKNCEEWSSKNNGSLLKWKASVEMSAMDYTKKVESEWICRKGSLELHQRIPLQLQAL
ncbi:hypothetical protein TNCT_408611 [Trichonephila clavata]|uniref:Uncharacterized protein n=1 Tax=Trichonephila clavata TaxID=2740835 RepID=A0A8X6L368_TRICU|nr:hypothetical protein TNCT_408611 [Trichonephila clavata]